MTDTNPPPEAQRFGRSQTPESPRPVHLPEPSNIPVLLNQMDPVFNDTETYNIPHNQNFSPFSDIAHAMHEANSEEQDAVQNFFRAAEEENARLESGPDANGQTAQNDSATEATLLSTFAENPTYTQSSATAANIPEASSGLSQPTGLSGIETTSVPEVDHANAVDATATRPNGAELTSEPPSSVQPDIHFDYSGVDYQSLLDTISQSASTAPAADPVSAPTTAPSLVDPGTQSMYAVPGLPPKPPVQADVQDNSAYQTFPNPSMDMTESYQHVNIEAVQANNADSIAPGSNPSMIQGLSTQFPGSWPQATSQLSPNNASPTMMGQHFQPPEPARSVDATERPWTPRTQTLYDQFLEDERRYVTEGIWDKFPHGSRLFVGNLPSEKVTKRDLFHTFHRHGRLAQISIKQAYGFVQYLEAASCSAALAAEQGVEIRGRKVHLEISKPQKNTKNQGQGNKRRRSRSPERGGQRQNDRQGRSSYSEYRDDRHRRDDYRPARSPSPRGYRSRDDYRPSVQSPRFGPGGRPASPYGANFPPPIPAGYDEESTLPLPRRDPREVPDVQLLILEPSVAQSFINWIEQGFRSKGLRASTIWLSPRLPLNGVVKRQIIEGVQAVVKLSQAAQYNSKIPLQVFDRSSGASNVNFNEYVDLDVPVAADIIQHARQKERGFAQAPQFPPQGYSQPQYSQPTPQYQPQVPPAYPPQQQPQFQYGQPPQYQGQHGQPPTPVTPSTAAPNLQQLLANLRQPGDHQSPANARPPQDLAGLLSNVARQQNQAGQFPQQPPQQQQQGYGGSSSYVPGQQPQQNVQNIMETLARYNR
ncbi:hypothetical protein EDD36DRAFT_447435 [Exophiala viscosa]|uniref:RRM domain-containing protein n=1 Tax=Exophiala viscosa TaxID=2486360 RepID=A0AAN6DLG1_9EURO|nr:hypothetical protein EDD36DRAFT_447435 [Exophiala viscosa]